MWTLISQGKYLCKEEYQEYPGEVVVKVLKQEILIAKKLSEPREHSFLFCAGQVG